LWSADDSRRHADHLDPGRPGQYDHFPVGAARAPSSPADTHVDFETRVRRGNRHQPEEQDMNHDRLEGSIALVTGAARRLGRAMALALAREGVSVIVHYRNSGEEARAVAREIEACGVRAWTVQGDLACAEGVETLWREAIDQAGPVDILVNNASIFEPSTLEDVTGEELDRNVQIHAMAPLQLARNFAAQAVPGVVVNLLDTRVVTHDRSHVAYHLSKQMLHSLTRLMALEFAPGVRVNAVAPGLVLPPPGEDEGYLTRLAADVPLRHHGAADDVAEAVVFLVRNTFVTGQVIFVDGGAHLKGHGHG
jgi:pteridine reductase